MTYALLGDRSRGVRDFRGSLRRPVAPSMARHFGGPSIPKQQAPPNAAAADDKATQDAAADAIKRRASARGYQSTVLRSAMMYKEGEGGGLQKTFGA